jgi:hypothetical protein
MPRGECTDHLGLPVIRAVALSWAPGLSFDSRGMMNLTGYQPGREEGAGRED